MLGVYYACAGDGTNHCTEMVIAGVEWVDGLRARPLHRRDAWLSFHLQLTMKLSFGMAAVVHPPKKIDETFQSLLFQALPMLGVNRNITKFWRTLPVKYQGLGLPDFVIVSLGAKISFLLRHWGFDDVAGQAMMQAFEAFVVKCGLYGNVFDSDFKRLGCLSTDGTWFKNLWETLRFLGIQLLVCEEFHLQPLREGDASILGEFARLGYQGAALARLARVAHFKAAIHLSDLVNCDGQTFACEMLDDSPGRSMVYSFPRQRPTSGDLRHWARAVSTLGSTGVGLGTRLGEYIRPRHRPTEWFLAGDENHLYSWDEASDSPCHEVFIRHPTQRPTRFRQLFVWSRSDVGPPPRERYASVSVVTDDTVALESYAPVPARTLVPSGFWPVLRSFPNQSLWSSFTCDGDGEWLRRGLRLGSLVVVHDGSYMPHVDRTICSAAFIIYCTHSRLRAKGAVVECTPSADNYRGEILGGLMVQLITRHPIARSISTVIIRGWYLMGIRRRGRSPTSSRRLTL